MLEQSESLNSDEVRNDDGDEVVDPPNRWIDADDHESLDDKLAAENSENPGADESGDYGRPEVIGDDELDRMEINDYGRTRGQVDGTPEDGDSFFDVEK